MTITVSPAPGNTVSRTAPGTANPSLDGTDAQFMLAYLQAQQATLPDATLPTDIAQAASGTPCLSDTSDNEPKDSREAKEEDALPVVDIKATLMLIQPGLTGADANLAPSAASPLTSSPEAAGNSAAAASKNAGRPIALTGTNSAVIESGPNATAEARNSKLEGMRAENALEHEPWTPAVAHSMETSVLHGESALPEPPDAKAMPAIAYATAISSPPASRFNAIADTIVSKVGTPQWTHDLSERVAVMVNSGASIAELKLTPPDMGPIEIRIDFSDANPTLTISVQNTDTRNSLDVALPRLREMLLESGVELGGASIEHRESNAQDNPRNQASPQGHLTGDLSLPNPSEISSLRHALSVQRLIDTYA